MATPPTERQAHQCRVDAAVARVSRDVEADRVGAQHQLGGDEQMHWRTARL